jgi:hypothetical protein
MNSFLIFIHACLFYILFGSNFACLQYHFLLFDASEERAIFMERMDYECTTILHCTYQYNASIKFINTLIDIGGRELVIATNTHGDTALHLACNGNTSIETINRLIDIGGRELLSANDNQGNFPLVAHLLAYYGQSNKTNKVSYLISRGIIQDQVQGKFGIGGLFNFASKEGQRIIFLHWNKTILPALLEMNTHLISRQPILEAAIIARAPPHHQLI